MKLQLCHFAWASVGACLVSAGLAWAMPATVAAEDATGLAVESVRMFPNLRIRRPVVIGNAGDGTNRIFVCEEQGVIRVFPNDQTVEDTQVFLDMESRVQYADKMNEEGMLGMAFHPQYKENGQFFLYYTARDPERTSIISRFRVSKDDPNKADPESEEVLMRIKQPFWNHNGGTLAFGPDGYLYIALGDGGARDDPLKSAQDLKQLLGSILRIDVDKATATQRYSIPTDNPFVDVKGAKPEIYAYGFRNIWRMSFDRKTGQLWAGDVGQDLWEEIDIVVKGGNYGWSVREAMHPATPKQGPAGTPSPLGDKLIEPVFEYNHEVGKSITGGYVYRGKKVPALAGKYLYADYVGGQIWALDYDMAKKKVVANYLIDDNDRPVITFGEDEQGEVYYSDAFGMIYGFQPKK
ncbi:PQQ-dependent sugar dehydrogenase [Lignipirellula cremea]|uniref:Soluble aldose sugar dehydrogenase YliI n=1 Tax=Lignipirellula cremea TaxID=2528010 RepID=A0A518E1T4_9BACT|nr:PQQ-dependent sugar dehydrogenase [Lignipirellula cremea]QDU98057.1 Soluble aldose sugar dehydrogenase YliI precursor [Lignipirellula cremea]